MNQDPTSGSESLFERYKRLRSHLLTCVPRPIYFLVIYALGYWGGVYAEPLKAVAIVVEPSLSVVSALKYGYIALCTVHFGLLLAGARAASKGRSPLWLDLDQPGRSAAAAATAGCLAFAIAMLSRGDKRTVHDVELVRHANEKAETLEKSVFNSVQRALGKAQSTVRWTSGHFFGAGRRGEPLDALVDSLRREYATLDDAPTLDLLVFEPPPANDQAAPIRARLVFPPLSAAPDYVEEMLRTSHKVVGGQGDPADHWWVQWTPLGYFVVAAAHAPGQGTVLAASLWSEREFFDGTEDLWSRAADVASEAGTADTSRLGLFLLTPEHTITYSTEVSDFGESLERTQSEPMPLDTLTEVESARGVRYFVEHAAASPYLSGMRLRIGLPFGTRLHRAGIWTSLAVVLVALWLFGGFFLHEAHQRRDKALPADLAAMPQNTQPTAA